MWSLGLRRRVGSYPPYSSTNKVQIIIHTIIVHSPLGKTGFLFAFVLGVLERGPWEEARVISTAQAPDALILKEVVGATCKGLAAAWLGRWWWWWWWFICSQFSVITGKRGVKGPDATPTRRSGLHEEEGNTSLYHFLRSISLDEQHTPIMCK